MHTIDKLLKKPTSHTVNVRAREEGRKGEEEEKGEVKVERGGGEGWERGRGKREGGTGDGRKKGGGEGREEEKERGSG